MKPKAILAMLAVALSLLAHSTMAAFTYDKNGETTHCNGVPLPPIQAVEQARTETEKHLSTIKAEEARQAELALNTHPSAEEVSPQEISFTGKPYIEEIGQYSFLFRNYDPELSHWTTTDPSGFPDGANNVAYMAVPTVEIDLLGLEAVHSGDFTLVGTAIESFRSLGWTAAVRRAELSLSNGEDEIAPQNEINALFAALAFSKKVNKSYFESIFIENGKSAFNYSAPYLVINYGVINGIPTNDLAAAYGNMGGIASGQFIRQDKDDKIFWSIEATFSFSDLYNFGGTDLFSSAFRRLQEAGMVSIYTTSGTYSKTFSGVLE